MTRKPSAPDLSKSKAKPAKGKAPPPAGLSPAAKRIWIDIVASLRGDYFVVSDLPLLRAYVGALAGAEEARLHVDTEGAVVEGKANVWGGVLERELRNVAVLATRLRLAPQSRLDRKVAGVHARPDGAVPWQKDPVNRYFDD